MLILTLSFCSTHFQTLADFMVSFVLQATRNSTHTSQPSRQLWRQDSQQVGAATSRYSEEKNVFSIE